MKLRNKIKRALITGAAGFIGSNLADALLQRDYYVIGIDNLSIGSMDNVHNNLTKSNYDFHKLDITNLNKFKEISKSIDIIVHLAALKIPKYGGAKETLITNTKGTKNVLEVARLNKAKVIITSSSDVYGKNSNLPLNEESDLVLGRTNIKRWSYAASKIFDEHLTFAYQEAYGLQAVILRPFNSYGPRNDSTWRGGPQSLFIEAILKNKSIEIHGDGSQTRSFTYISDTIEGIIRAMEQDLAVGEVFNIGNNLTEISIKDLAYLIKRLSKTNGELKANFIAHKKLFGDYEEIERRVPNISKASEILGFKPKVGLEEGLTRTIDWHRKRLSLVSK
ncbi:MAG: NAD-dependent epimerase/dehydratase family protein [Actinobacteria bacterium]|nr:MAG: NAD-dependent epimerase/dehydratase family protein [Actinomycetota bacterium]